MPRAAYPGSFDPVTNGHLDVIERGSRLFEELVVLVAINPRKDGLFTPEERVDLIRKEIAPWANVSVETCEGLTVDHLRTRGLDTILRGVRNTDDFNLEYRMALTNRTLAPEIETVWVAPALEWSYLSSTLIREVVRSGGDASRFVPASVATVLAKKWGHS